MNQKLDARIKEAVDVSGAFDNCFFHTYAAHLLANKLPLPNGLFNFKSILGEDSAASKLMQRFPNYDALALFGEYHKRHSPDVEPFSPEFIVEKTLVLGFLFREWFATQMAADAGNKAAMANGAITAFKEFKEFREGGASFEDLLSGPEGVLYQANREFLDYFYQRPKLKLSDKERRFESYFTDAENDIDKALKVYWQAEGYQNYCRELANPQTKLSYKEVQPVIIQLKQPLTIYNQDGGVIVDNEIVSDTPKLEVTLEALAGHYHLLKTEKSAPLLKGYETSYAHYKVDRESVLATLDDKDLTAETKPSLLVGAICPKGHLKQDPFACLLNKIDSMDRYIKDAIQMEKEAQRKQQRDTQLLESDKENQSPNTTSPSAKATLPNEALLGQKSQNIDELLNAFEHQITQIGDYESDAKQAANHLLAALRSEKEKAFNNPTVHSLRSFQSQVGIEFEKYKPRLEKDISFLQAAANLAIKIVNVLTQILSFGFSSGLFRPYKAKALENAEQLQSDIHDKLDPPKLE
ncbi:hypothetical protein [Legionella sp. W05-934-2]|jgi:hypothetical protein|uniref:Dot/Icm T4SS effector Ceg23 n=1 Tax=Legionella sp. W05-934-2 TaxID=1198649 RepID=UPI003462B6DE